ncbi:hypothetical protein FUA48_12885 [Flavobacterium alkalisoli]|uniref:YcxB family protein n=1 Tax=Flavobacterium alkalisoli TaxID=2602769 RepID=A0A5B9FTY6_9FLAO|nr:hypothetical protein [Flavobacterium alkalisoli]QEE50435.1 hypothetical protein FUA48_12885 [Flavobacterium alkalisoli]
MKFEIPFNPTLYKEKTINVFNHIWYTRIRNTHLLMVQAILITIIGIWFLASGLTVAMSGYLFIAVGIHLFINCSSHYINISRNRKKQYRYIESAIQKNKNTIAIVEFNKEAFHYESAGISVILNWDNCTGFKVIKKNYVLLYFNTSFTPAYLISKEEVTPQGFNDIISFLENKNWYPAAIPTL